MPTVLNYLHYDKPYFAFGKDMINPKANDFVVNTLDNTYQITKGDYALLYNNDKTEGLYNYRTDILMKNNLVKENPSKKEELEKHLKAFIQHYNQHNVENSFKVK